MPPHALVQLLRGEGAGAGARPSAARITWEGGRYVVAIDSKHSARQSIELLPLDADWNRPFAEQRLLVTGVSVEQLDVPPIGSRFRSPDGEDGAAAKDPDGIDPPVPPSGPACDAPAPTRIQFEVPEGGPRSPTAQPGSLHNPRLLSAGSFEQEAPARHHADPLAVRRLRPLFKTLRSRAR